MAGEDFKGRLLAGRYRLLGSLGRGGMGAVWHARDEVLDREVAIKEILLPPELPEADRDILRRRTLREARSAARLSHPNVVAMYDVVEEEGRPWIVMELVKSRTLADALREDGPLPSRQVAQIGLQVLAALEAAHPAGVLHRDVKPSNVLLAEDGRVVLTDFGIATLEGDASLTQSGTLVGSPAYIAPERVRARGAGPESDLWSLGATLYTAVEGRPPHDRGSAIPTLTAAVTEPPDPPKLAGTLWPALDGLLRKEPAERIDAPTARRLLEKAAAAPSVVAAPPPRPPAATVRLPATAQQPPATAPQPPAAPPQPPATAAQPPATAAQPSAAAPQPSTPAQEPAPAADQSAAAASEPSADTPEPTATSDHGQGTRVISLPPSVGGSTSNRRKVPAALAVAALLAGALGAWAVFRPDDDNNQTLPPSTSSASPTTTPSTRAPSSTPSATGSTRTTTSSAPSARPSTPRASAPSSAPSTPSPSAPSSRPTSTAVPAGFERHNDPTGFSMVVPRNWTVSREGGRVYFREPGGSRLLLIDQTDQPKADPVADWRQQEAARRDGYAEYRRIRIEAVDYFQKAADWEFTYAVRNGRQHVLNRGVVTSPRQAYGIYWSTPESQWDESQATFRTITSSFRPAS